MRALLANGLWRFRLNKLRRSSDGPDAPEFRLGLANLVGSLQDTCDDCCTEAIISALLPIQLRHCRSTGYVKQLLRDCLMWSFITGPKQTIVRPRLYPEHRSRPPVLVHRANGRWWLVVDAVERQRRRWILSVSRPPRRLTRTTVS